MKTNATGTLAALAAALGLLAAHSLSRPFGLEAATCGGAGEVVCKIGKSCVWLGFFSQCYPVYYYWSDTGDGGGGDDKTLSLGEAAENRSFA